MQVFFNSKMFATTRSGMSLSEIANMKIKEAQKSIDNPVGYPGGSKPVQKLHQSFPR
jgi:hypothetical protein